MTVDARKLVKMAEQITANLRYTDDEAVVAARVADHLNRFWDPRMKAAIKAHAKSNSDDLSTTVSAAIELLTLAPPGE